MCDYCDDIATFRGFGAANTEGLSALLASFFYHWAALHDYRGAVVTIRRRAPLTKAEKGWWVWWAFGAAQGSPAHCKGLLERAGW